MSKKTIIILHNEKESKIELNLEEITSYSILKKKILDFYEESDDNVTYHLMAINSSNPYTLLEEENYNQILNEKIEGEDLKLFLNKISPESINNDNSNRKVEYASNEFNNDEDFVIETDENDDKNKNEKEEKIDININNNINNNININNEGDSDVDKQLKIDENIGINNDEKKNEEDDKDLFSQTDEMMKRIDQLIGGDNFQLLNDVGNINIKNKEENKIEEEKNENIIEEDKKIEEEKDKIIIEEDNNPNIINNNINININEIKKKENVKKAPLPFSKKNPVLKIINNNVKNNFEDDEENNEFFDENSLSSKYIYPNTFKSIKCIICHSQLSWVKYICCVCENCVMCVNCEKTHYHPCFKLKSDFLSNTTDIYRFISTFYSFKQSKNFHFITKFFTKDYEMKMCSFSDKKICLRPKKNFLFPIKIINMTNNAIKSSQFEIIPKNNKIIRMQNPNKPFSLDANGNNIIKFKCSTRNCKGKEKIEFILFSDALTIKHHEGINFSLDFEINEDWEEEQINLFFENNEFAMLYNKEHKQLAKDILTNIGKKNFGKDYIKNVFDILVNCNWDKKKALNKINELK